MAVTGLQDKARVIVAQQAESDRNRWIIGTFASANNKVK
jgi:hypothetical protein